jgi:hypothetical protein
VAGSRLGIFAARRSGHLEHQIHGWFMYAWLFHVCRDFDSFYEPHEISQCCLVGRMGTDSDRDSDSKRSPIRRIESWKRCSMTC